MSFAAPHCTANLVHDDDDDATWKYAISSSVAKATIVDLQFVRTAPGLKIGKDGTSYYGTDQAAPWGSMRHTFWPKAKVSGTVVVNGQVIDLADEKGFFVHALQGMKPHHAAARWNFVNFQGAKYSAMIMEFTTPPSYGSRMVNIGGIMADDRNLGAFIENSVKHEDTKKDTETGWLEPGKLNVTWKNDKAEARLECVLKDRIERVDVLFEVPQFVKSIVSNVAGTNPYVYQVRWLHALYILLKCKSVLQSRPTRLEE